MDKIQKINADFFKLALMIRRTEDKFLELFEQGKMNGTVHTCNGQEFSAIAFSSALGKDDFIPYDICEVHYIDKMLVQIDILFTKISISKNRMQNKYNA